MSEPTIIAGMVGNEFRVDVEGSERPIHVRIVRVRGAKAVLSIEAAVPVRVRRLVDRPEIGGKVA